MATSQLYNGDGSTTAFTFSVPYINATDVKAEIAGVSTTAFSLSGTTVTFNTAPAAGSNNIKIFRDTNNTTIEANFQSGSALRAVDFNDNFTQLLYVTQESDDASSDAVDDASAAVVTANAASSAATNAVNTANAADTAATNAVNTANAASAAATSATNTANNAASQAAAAVSTANSAASDATAAVSTANTASTNASNAVSTANTANTNATAAATSATSAQTSATSAQNSATAAAASAAAAANISDAFTATGTPATALTVDVPIHVANGVKLPTNANSYDQEGAIRYNTTLDKIEIRKGSGWNTAAGGATISSTPPSLASEGDVWYDHDNGRSYVYYNDGDSNQWVEMNPSWNGSVADDSVTPAKLSTGGPNWDTNGKILVNGARSHIDANSSSYFQSTNNQTGQTATDGCVFGVSSGTNAILWNYESANLTFGTGNVSRMVIDNSGNISVGPSGASNIALNANGSITAAAGGCSINEYGRVLVKRTDNSDTVQAFEVQNSSSTPTVLIKGNGSAYFAGNIGVGNTSPGYKLSVLTTGTTDTSLHLATTGGASANGDATNSVRFTGGTNTRWANAKYEAFKHIFHANGVEKMRLDSSGDLGLGVAPDNVGSMRTLHIKGPTNEGAAIRLQAHGDTPGSSDAQIYKNSAALYLRVDGTDPLIAYLNGSERLRVDNNGSLIVGTGSDSVPNGTSIGGSGFINETNNRKTLYVATTASSDGLARFYNSNGQVGTITVSGSATSYNTSSDYRLKENVVDLADSITRVKQLQPKRFNFIADADTTVDGFLAHEAQAVVPEAVTGEKDGEEMQGIDQSKLVPLLTAALQEAIAKIETLETKVAQLEANN